MLDETESGRTVGGSAELRGSTASEVQGGDAGEDRHRNRNARLALFVQFSRGAPGAWVLLSGASELPDTVSDKITLAFVGPARGSDHVPEPSSVAGVPEH